MWEQARPACGFTNYTLNRTILRRALFPQMPISTLPTNCFKFYVQKELIMNRSPDQIYCLRCVLCPLLAKGVLVPLDVAPRCASWLLGNGLVAPGVVAQGPSAILEAALGGPLVLMTTVKLTLTSYTTPWFTTTTCAWFASNTSASTTGTTSATTSSASSTCS